MGNRIRADVPRTIAARFAALERVGERSSAGDPVGPSRARRDRGGLPAGAVGRMRPGFLPAFQPFRRSCTAAVRKAWASRTRSFSPNVQTGASPISAVAGPAAASTFSGVRSSGAFLRRAFTRNGSRVMASWATSPARPAPPLPTRWRQSTPTWQCASSSASARCRPCWPGPRAASSPGQ